MKNMFFILIATLISFPTIGEASSSEKTIKDVRIINFPKTQNIDGSVEIEGLIKHSIIDRREKVIIPPAKRSDTSNLTEAGVLHADGFTSIVLSILGEAKSETFTPGDIGAILIPDETTIIRAFAEDQAILFPLEVKTKIIPETLRYFGSESEKQTIGFPKYRIYLYNSTNKSVEANLYMYLTN
ncbi:hypothetical protein [Malonomonas rubra]|uniref:hypothetical protein n=1 Tax=Malonomonas rubra TaxID=57040 RepID=UPI0026E96E07|nr:hypothetical protein [Malonomonas rubra]